ncbi:MAG: peptidoglycan bridge formation glycyltransferase FemA/FemB family protein, partial [Methanothrix sp.]
METPHLSAFLHCPAWEQHLLDQTKQVIAQPEGLYTRHSLPASRWHKGQYWQANRLNIQPGWQLPPLPQRPWFIRLQAQDFLGHQALTYFLTNNQIAHVRVPSYQPKQTQFLDLRQNLDQILDQMKPKHRYNIKVAEKNGLQVEIIQHQLFEALPRFLHILEETNARHGLIAHPRAHYASILKALEPEHQAWLVFAKLGSKDIATAMIIVCGEVGTYLHGGSDYTQRAQMAPYLMHYQIIQALKEQGAHYYDLWGTNAVSSPD